MNKIDPINLSPSFLSRLLLKGYDYAVGEKLGLVQKETSSMNAGKVMHSFLSGAFGGKIDDIAISPYDDFRSKEARNWRDSQPDNVLIIKQKEADLYAELTERVKNHPEVKKILEGAKIEAEKTIERKVKDYKVKGVIDLIAEKDGMKIVIDHKFVGSQIFDDFERKSRYSNYDLQAAVYDFLVNPTHTYFLVIESEAPYRIKMCYASSSYLEAGASKFDRALQVIKQEAWRTPSFDLVGVQELKDWGY